MDRNIRYRIIRKDADSVCGTLTTSFGKNITKIPSDEKLTLSELTNRISVLSNDLDADESETDIKEYSKAIVVYSMLLQEMSKYDILHITNS